MDIFDYIGLAITAPLILMLWLGAVFAAIIAVKLIWATLKGE